MKWEDQRQSDNVEDPRAAFLDELASEDDETTN